MKEFVNIIKDLLKAYVLVIKKMIEKTRKFVRDEEEKEKNKR